jgi:hypothetical protein
MALALAMPSESNLRNSGDQYSAVFGCNNQNFI